MLKNLARDKKKREELEVESKAVVFRYVLINNYY